MFYIHTNIITYLEPSRMISVPIYQSRPMQVGHREERKDIEKLIVGYRITIQYNTIFKSRSMEVGHWGKKKDVEDQSSGYSIAPNPKHEDWLAYELRRKERDEILDTASQSAANVYNRQKNLAPVSRLTRSNMITSLVLKNAIIAHNLPERRNFFIDPGSLIICWHLKQFFFNFFEFFSYFLQQFTSIKALTTTIIK